MKLASPLVKHVIEFRDNVVSSLVIENPRLLRDYVQGLYDAVTEGEREFVLSEDGKDLRIGDELELIDRLVPFDLNSKTLTAALLKRLEKIALQPENRLESARLVAEFVNYVNRLSMEVSHEIECEKETIGVLLKALGPRFADDDTSLSNRVLDYMRLMRDFAGRHIFVFVNARSYLSDNELSEIFDIALSEKLRVLLIDSSAKGLLPNEDRLLIDDDLCELTTRDDEDLI